MMPCDQSLAPSLLKKSFVTHDEAPIESRTLAKFYVCPAPSAQDSYFFYEAIYTGAIPIVVREPFHDVFVKNGVIIHFVGALDGITESELLIKSKIPQVSELPDFLDISYQVNLLLKLTKIPQRHPGSKLTDDEVKQVERFANKKQIQKKNQFSHHPIR